MKPAVGDVFYYEAFNKFFHVRAFHDDYVVCGDFTDYWSSSTSSTVKQNLSYAFFRREGLHKANTPDTCRFCTYNGIGWRVIEREKAAKHNERQAS